jgi:predicted component of type VI protein secretion system
MADHRNDRCRLPVLEVFIYRAGSFCGTECFAQEEIFIGRDPRLDLSLLDEMISRAHAVLCVENDRLIIQDLDSTNGILVNGQPVLHATLGSLDQVSIGSFVLRFHLYSSPACDVREKALAPVVKLDNDTLRTVEVPTLPEMEATQECLFQLVGLPEPEDVQTDKIENSWNTQRTDAPRLRCRARGTTQVEDEEYLRLLAS